MHNWAIEIGDWGLGIKDWGLRGKKLKLTGIDWNIQKKIGWNRLEEAYLSLF